MPDKLTAEQVLDREFLEIRAKILEVGASLDRLERADGSVESDRRLELIQKAIGILNQSDTNRAEQIQLLFSRQYENDWRNKMDINPRY